MQNESPAITIMSLEGKVLYQEEHSALHDQVSALYPEDNEETRKSRMRNQIVRNALKNGVPLPRAMLSYVNLYECKHPGTKLPEAVLYKCNWASGSIEGGDIHGATLIECNLQSWNMVEANAKDARFVKCNLENAIATRAQLEMGMFPGCDMPGVRFDEIVAPGLQLSGSNATSCNFKNAIMPGANASGVNLAKAVWRDIEAPGLNVSGSDLQKSQWNNTPPGLLIEEAVLHKAEGLDHEAITPMEILRIQPGRMRRAYFGAPKQPTEEMLREALAELENAEKQHKKDLANPAMREHIEALEKKPPGKDLDPPTVMLQKRREKIEQKLAEKSFVDALEVGKTYNGTFAVGPKSLLQRSGRDFGEVYLVEFPQLAVTTPLGSTGLIYVKEMKTIKKEKWRVSETPTHH